MGAKQIVSKTGIGPPRGYCRVCGFEGVLGLLGLSDFWSFR